MAALNAIEVAIIGNPNTGKTTVFNQLTGSSQRVGNWAGVTVERKSGTFIEENIPIELIDLPGIYSLHTSSIDERIASDYLLSFQAQAVLNIVDASHLERSLYLSLQLLEMGLPLVLAVNMLDVARSRELTIDCSELAHRLGCAVVELEANHGKGIAALKKAIVQIAPQQEALVPAFQLAYSAPIEEAIAALMPLLESANSGFSPAHYRSLAIRLLEEDESAMAGLDARINNTLIALRIQLNEALGEDVDILIADARYQFIQQQLAVCVTKKQTRHRTLTDRIDSIVLSRVLGVPLFLGIMYLMFVFAINVGGAFQDFFEMTSDTLFVHGLGYLLQQWQAPAWLIAMLAGGVGMGITTTVGFIPVIGGLFLFLSLLESSGYMARAAFVMDRLMGAMGLPGKSFVPLIVGFGCNVPAIMGARTIENPRDRILTIMMTPFMSCGARLAIYAVFTSAFFPTGGQNIVFALYLIGILMAVLTGLLVRKALFVSEPSPLLMELPPYHVPVLKNLLLNTWYRLKSFLVKAGVVILPLCVVIGFLNGLTLSGGLHFDSSGHQDSLLSAVGRTVTPVFGPMGITQDNWPATVGIATGMLAKEVVVATLNTLYIQVGHLAHAASSVNFDLWGGLQEALQSIPDNFQQIASWFTNPVLASAPIDTVGEGVYGQMYQRFDGKVGAFAYLLFLLLYFPCVAATGAMVRELNRGWAVFSVIWTTGLAYAAAVIFYQGATFMRHPASSLSWIIGCGLGLWIIPLLMHAIVRRSLLTDQKKPLMGETS